MDLRAEPSASISSAGANRMRCLRWSALPISALVLLAPTGQQNEAVTLPLVGQAMAQTGTPQPSLGRVGQGYKQDYPQGHEPLQLLPKTASPSKTTAIKLGCSNVDSVLRPLCELSEALLNRTCESIHDRDQKFACNLALLGESEHDQYYRLKLICDADWIPTVAKECAARAARLGPGFKEQLAADRKAKIAKRRVEAEVDAQTAFDRAKRVLGECVRNQAANLMVTAETAEAVAAAALQLCRTELRNAARAMAYTTDLKFWSEGPQPRHCVDGSSRCADAEKAIYDPFLPALAAKVMHDRAEAARTPGQLGNTPAAPRPPSGSADSFGTAFFVSKDGTALTNAHVVERCKQVRVGIEGRQGMARIVARDEKNDLALLATDLRPIQVATWRPSVRQGEDIVVYGFPLTGVLASGGNVVTGNVTALAGLANDSRFLQISAPVQPGNSGGPLLDRNGNVVGIVVATLDALGIASATGDIPQNVNFAIKASVTVSFLDAQHVVHTESTGTAVLSTPEIAERAKALTLQVACVR
jgi:S1-C subfamily serine protease